MHDPIIIGCAVLGGLLAVCQAIVSWCLWKQLPDILRICEVFVSTLLIYSALHLARITWALPSDVASDQDKMFMFLADLILFWMFATTVGRLFKRR